MKSKVQKDLHRRKFINAEKALLLQKWKDSSSTTSVYSSFLKKIISISTVRNHCIFSNRSRAVFKRFKCSRIFLRQWGIAGSFCGFRKQALYYIFSLCGGKVDTVDSKSITLRSLLVQIQSKVSFFIQNLWYTHKHL